MKICKECNCSFKNLQALGLHVLKYHKMSLEVYYKKYIDPNAGICIHCGSFTKFRGLGKGFNRFCSIKCSRNSPEVIDKMCNTNVAKYGTKCPLQNSDVHSKTVASNLKKYGCECSASARSIQQKIESTNLKKYGVRRASQRQETIAKMEATNVQRYGVKIVSQNFQIQSKVKQTMLKKFGTSSCLSNPEIRKRISQTNIERYGTEYPSQCLTIRNKVKQTCLKKYGYEFSACVPFIKQKIQTSLSNPDVQSRIKRKYKFKEKRFDSSWEVAAYIYLCDHGFNVIPHPTDKTFTYEFGGAIHKYLPDFKVNDEYWEIKGPQFFDENMRLVNPFDSSKNPQWAKKLECMQNNGIKIVTDCNKFLQYVKEKYGNTFLNGLKIY